MIHQYKTLEDTIYFWFGSNDTSGSGGDGATPVYDVRLAGAAADAIPVLSGSATLLTHANYPDGCHEVAIAATAANGFAAGNTYAVFCTLLVDSQNPTGYIGSFVLGPILANLAYILAHLLTQTGTQVADGFQHFFDVATPAVTVADAMVGTNNALTTKTGYTLTNLSDANAGKLEDMLDGTGAVLTLTQLRVNSSAAGGAVDIDNSAGPGVSVATSAGDNHGIVVTAFGNAQAIDLTGGATGNGVTILGGSTSGDGLNVAAATSGQGIQVTGKNTCAGIVTSGQGSAPGLQCQGGATGPGIKTKGGASGGAGLQATAESGSNANGITASKDGSGYDIDANIHGTIDTATDLTNPTGDWQDGGRLDNLLDAIPTTAMRGTDNAALATKLEAYVQLLARSDAAITTDRATELAEINADEGTGAGNYAATTDSQEAIRDNQGTAQTGDAYAVVNHATYGNAKLVRSTTPANALDVSNTGEAGLDFANIKNATGAHTLTNITVPNVTTVATTTTNSDMVGTNSAMLATEDGSNFTAIPWNGSWDTEVQSECDDALVANNLDHLCKTVVANNADMTAEVPDGTILSNILSKTSDTSTYVVADDSLQGISEGAAGGGLSAQETRDAMKLAPTAGAPAAGSVDKHLDDASTHDAAAVYTAFGTGGNLTTCATATGFNTVVPPSLAQFNARTIVSANYFVVSDYTTPPTAIENADALLGRNVSNVEATAPEHSLCTIILATLESSISDTTWTILRSDGSTTHATKTVSTDADANPIVGVQ